MAEGIIWRNSDLNGLQTQLAARGAGGKEVVSEILEEAAQFGRDKMVEHIETRATAWGRSQGRTGRIETGKMDDEVDFVVGESKAGRQKISVGWVNTAEREDYFKWQEQGFTHTDGHDVPPMHALLDAFIETREKVRKDIAEAIAAGRI